MFCQVIVDIAHEDVDRVFTYRIPKGMELCPGMRVHVPFGRQKQIEGVVVGITEECDLPESRVRGFDFCEEMLNVARERAKKIPGAETVEFAFGDCMALPLADASVDAVTIAYGVRNFEDRQRGLHEILRVLKPGGKAFILEFLFLIAHMLHMPLREHI